MGRPKKGEGAPRPTPTDKEIMSYNNVPIDIAARYIGIAESSMRLALREGRVNFGFAAQGAGSHLIYNISPGGLVKYKREGLTVVPFEKIQDLLTDSVCQLVDAKLGSMRQLLDMVADTENAVTAHNQIRHR